MAVFWSSALWRHLFWPVEESLQGLLPFSHGGTPSAPRCGDPPLALTPGRLSLPPALPSSTCTSCAFRPRLSPQPLFSHALPVTPVMSNSYVTNQSMSKLRSCPESGYLIDPTRTNLVLAKKIDAPSILDCGI